MRGTGRTGCRGAFRTIKGIRDVAIEDKHHAFIFGIIAGVPSHEVDSDKVLYATDAPYEFRDQLLQRWLLAHHGWADWCVFRRKVTGRFGMVTGDSGNVTDDFGNVTDRTGRQDWRCA